MKLRNIMILVLMIMLIMSGCSNNEQPDSSASGNNSVETVSDLEALQDGIEWLEDGLIGPADEPEIVSGDISHIEEANSTLYKAGESKCHEYTEKALENELAAIEYDISDNDIDIADLDAAVYNLAVKNVYLNIQYYSDVMEAAIINSHGEVVTEDSAGNVLINFGDSRCIYTSDTGTSWGKEMSTLGVILSGVTNMYDSNVDYYTQKTTYDGVDYYEFVVDFHDRDEIKQLYSYIGDEYGEQMFNSIKASVASSGENKDNLPINVRLSYVLDGNGLSSFGFYYYFGDEVIPDEESWSNCYVVYNIDSMIAVPEWKLSDKWYEIDFDSLEEDDWEGVSELFQSDLTIISDILKGIFEDSAIEEVSPVTSGSDTDAK